MSVCHRTVRQAATTLLSASLLMVSGFGVAADAESNTDSATPCETWQPEFAATPGLIIGDIDVRVDDVFDTELETEQRGIHKLTNRLHYKTQPSVVRNQLLFSTGDTFLPTRLAETARLLRRNRYLRSATVKPVELCGQHVAISVRTSDYWTLTPSLSYTRAGGVTSWSIEVQELNFLGLGKELKVTRKNKGDDGEALFQYRDTNVLGSRYSLGLEKKIFNGEDSWQFALSLPFYADHASKGWGILVRDSRVLSRYVLVNERRALSQTSRVDVAYQQKLRLKDAVYRVGAGWRIDTEEYTVDGSTAPETSAFEFDYSYPYVTFQFLQPEFLTRENLYSIGRTEDISTGFRFSLESGLISEHFGNDDNLMRLNLSLGNGWQLSESTLGVFSMSATDYLGTRRYATGLRAVAFHKLNENNLFQFNVNYQKRAGFSADHYLNVGGEFGLKGYPDRHQRGNKRVLAAAEFRHILDWYPFRLFRMAISGFYETGAAWTSEDPRNQLHNVGLGIAVSPTRTSTHNLLRFDVAYPLTDTDDLKSYQFYIGTQIRY